MYAGCRPEVDEKGEENEEAQGRFPGDGPPENEYDTTECDYFQGMEKGGNEIHHTPTATKSPQNLEEVRNRNGWGKGELMKAFI